jgi:hypothetical protein
MKMETVIRSPQNGVVKRLAHKEGVRSVPFRSLLPKRTPGFLCSQLD